MKFLIASNAMTICIPRAKLRRVLRKNRNTMKVKALSRQATPMANGVDFRFGLKI
jgi:hypothetical protein